MAQYKDIVIPKGTSFSNAQVAGFGVVFSDAKQNMYDMGIRQAKFGEFDITAIVDRSKEDTAPFASPKNVNGFSVKIGTKVNIKLTKDVVNTIPTELIIFNGGQFGNIIDRGDVPPFKFPNNKISQTGSSTNESNKKLFSTQNIIIGIVVLGGIFGILKWKKII